MDKVPAVTVHAPNLLHVVEIEEQTERKNKREVDLITVSTVAAVPVLAPDLLHMVEKEEPIEEREGKDT
jgi:hypothetical protein